MGKGRYKISFGGLPVGIHEFEFAIDKKFFAEIENSEIAGAKINVFATLTKQNNTQQVHFFIEGTVETDCDRCMKTFDFPVQAEGDLVIKYGDPEESNDEILVIKEGETEFDASRYLYEYIVVSLPARKVPCEIDPAKYKCDKKALDKLEELNAKENNEELNPIWKELSKLKNKD